MERPEIVVRTEAAEALKKGIEELLPLVDERIALRSGAGSKPPAHRKKAEHHDDKPVPPGLDDNGERIWWQAQRGGELDYAIRLKLDQLRRAF